MPNKFDDLFSRFSTRRRVGGDGLYEGFGTKERTGGKKAEDGENPEGGGPEEIDQCDRPCSSATGWRGGAADEARAT